MGIPLLTHFGTGRALYQQAINVSGAGVNLIASGLPGYSILVMQFDLICAAAVSLRWESQDGTVLDGPCSYAANGGKETPWCEHGIFRTRRGDGLYIFLGAAIQVGGHVQYTYVDS